MTRRIAMLLVALIIPGGLVALFGVAVLKAISRTDSGRKALDRVATLLRGPPDAAEPARQAA